MCCKPEYRHSSVEWLRLRANATARGAGVQFLRIESASANRPGDALLRCSNTGRPLALYRRVEWGLCGPLPRGLEQDWMEDDSLGYGKVVQFANGRPSPCSFLAGRRSRCLR